MNGARSVHSALCRPLSPLQTGTTFWPASGAAASKSLCDGAPVTRVGADGTATNTARIARDRERDLEVTDVYQVRRGGVGWISAHDRQSPEADDSTRGGMPCRNRPLLGFVEFFGQPKLHQGLVGNIQLVGHRLDVRQQGIR